MRHDRGSQLHPFLQLHVGLVELVPDRASLGISQSGPFHQALYVVAIAGVGRHPASGSMELTYVPLLLQHAHLVPDSGRADGQAAYGRNGDRPYRMGSADIELDNCLENLFLALRQLHSIPPHVGISTLPYRLLIPSIV